MCCRASSVHFSTSELKLHTMYSFLPEQHETTPEVFSLSYLSSELHRPELAECRRYHMTLHCRHQTRQLPHRSLSLMVTVQHLLE